MSCSDINEVEEAVIKPLPPQYENAPNTPLLFVDNLTNKSAIYNAVRIGEYLWMDSNISLYEGEPFTKQDINLILTRYRIDSTLLKNVSVADINKHCGPYYNRERFEYLQDRNKCVIYEGEGKRLTKGWGAPSNNDCRQLFAMCGNATEEEVRLALAAKAGDNPVAIPGLTYWFSKKNTNKYRLNLMPAGARFNGSQVWKLVHNSAATDVDYFNIKTGDFYAFVEAIVIPTWDGRAAIDDYPHADAGKTWHWMPVRWCRKLTAQELGYRLYINKEQTEILKTSPTSSAPEDYDELPNGYLRGFYIQFILNNPNPTKTIREIVEMSENRS